MAYPIVIQHINTIGVLDNTSGFSSSDHRPFFIDVDRKIFDTKVTSIIPHTLRILQSTNTTSVQKYVKESLRQLSHQNIPNLLRQLKAHIVSNEFNEAARLELESIDQTVTSIRLNCEKQLVPPPTPFKYTSIAKQQVTKIRLLQTLQRHFQRQQDPAPTIATLHKLEVLQDLDSSTVATILSEEKQYLRKLKVDIDIHREDHLVKLSCEA